MDISVTVFLFVCFCVLYSYGCLRRGSGVEFCTVVHRRPAQGISHFGELCSPRSSPRSPKSDESVASPAQGRHGESDAGHAYDRHVWIDGRRDCCMNYMLPATSFSRLTFAGLRSELKKTGEI